MLKDSEVLVLFDFDSLIYSSKNLWRITNPVFGKLGSNVDVLWVLNLYLQKSKEHDFSLFDHCIPVLEDFPFVSQQLLFSENWNVLPVEKLQEALLHHRIRGRKVYFLTLILQHKLKEILFHKLSPYVEDHIFWQLEWKEYWRDPPQPQIRSYAFPRLMKFLFVKEHLKKLPYYQDEEFLPRTKYRRVFLYSTDIDFLKALQQYMLEHFDEYEYKNKTLISYLIAKLIT